MKTVKKLLTLSLFSMLLIMSTQSFATMLAGLHHSNLSWSEGTSNEQILNSAILQFSLKHDFAYSGDTSFYLGIKRFSSGHHKKHRRNHPTSSNDNQHEEDNSGVTEPPTYSQDEHQGDNDGGKHENDGDENNNDEPPVLVLDDEIINDHEIEDHQGGQEDGNKGEQVVDVPEPGTIFLLGFGLIAVYFVGRNKQLKSGNIKF